MHYTGMNQSSYDAVGNIETISENGVLKVKYYYDEINQLIREDNAYLSKTIRYQYDAGSNLVSKTEYAYTTGTPGTATATINYGYTDANWRDKLTSYNGQTITSDAIGNPLTYRDGLSFTWKNGRQLATASVSGKSMTYKYNADGIRTQKTVNGVATNYYLNGGNILTQISGSNRMDFFYDEKGSLIGFNLNGAKYYYIRNGQNDIIGILDSAGTQVVSYVYDSWGKLISTTGTSAATVGVQNPFRYRGYYYDTETGLYYLNSRYYDPCTGRFLNADAAIGTNSDLSSYNLFTYCGNNPVNRIDPSGTSWFGDIWNSVSNWAVNTWNSISNWLSSTASEIGSWFNSSVLGGISGSTLSQSGDDVVKESTSNIKTTRGFWEESPLVNARNEFVRTEIPVKNVGAIKAVQKIAKVGAISTALLATDIYNDTQAYKGYNIGKAIAVDVVGFSLACVAGSIIGATALPAVAVFVFTAIAGYGISKAVTWVKETYIE